MKKSRIEAIADLWACNGLLTYVQTCDPASSPARDAAPLQLDGLIVTCGSSDSVNRCVGA